MILLNRRHALAAMAGSVPALAWAQPAEVEITKGPFQGTRESLKAFRAPDWFRDAKFGIWAHWGPQSAAEAGDWYARNMYIEGDAQYKFHLAHYGHPSKVGFKDVISTFKAEKWDPEHLMDLYVRAGAKYFVSMGVHHDNFDMWDSRYQPRWNAAAAGPKKDIVGIWKQAARKRGLRFGVSEHLSNSFAWMATSHRSDKTGEFAGVPYDGADEKYSDLYHDYSLVPPDFMDKAKAMDRPPIDRWKQQYFNRIRDLVDQHQPDLLYTDGAIPYGEFGLSLVAHAYNTSAKARGGKIEAIYSSKQREDCAEGTCVLDLERGMVNRISPDPWQTDTCIGNWHYKKGITYKTPKTIVDMLVDIVSRNGNLLLNFPLPGSGELDADELRILEAITAWMRVNGEGIYGTRPWRVSGEGPSLAATDAGGAFNENRRKDLTAGEIRFTSKGSHVYAFVMGWPAGDTLIKSLNPARVHSVELLGHRGRVKWTQNEAGLKITMPPGKPCDHAVTLKIAVA
ncbi:MAG TPA: alpha-L-fucosidase [Bryobacteraceae bacterium]|nr:alpha-L-fucosidase [Bryobacteraceae bacterium]